MKKIPSLFCRARQTLALTLSLAITAGPVVASNIPRSSGSLLTPPASAARIERLTAPLNGVPVPGALFPRGDEPLAAGTVQADTVGARRLPELSQEQPQPDAHWRQFFVNE